MQSKGLTIFVQTGYKLSELDKFIYGWKFSGILSNSKNS